MSENSVKLIENFVSWQGEGADSGRSMIILRFKTCNLKCTWCDTRVKMRISQEASYTLQSIQDNINQTSAGLLITGGEPTVPKHFDETVSILNDLNYPVANVESNGFNLLNLIKETYDSKPIKFMYSPKIFNEDDLYNAKQLTGHLSSIENVHIKLVYEDNELIENYLNFLSNHNDLTWSHRVWIMPEGTNRTDLIKNSGKVFDACEKYKFNFSSRNHIIYGFI